MRNLLMLASGLLLAGGCVPGEVLAELSVLINLADLVVDGLVAVL